MGSGNAQYQLSGIIEFDDAFNGGKRSIPMRSPPFAHWLTNIIMWPRSRH